MRDSGFEGTENSFLRAFLLVCGSPAPYLELYNLPMRPPRLGHVCAVVLVALVAAAFMVSCDLGPVSPVPETVHTAPPTLTVLPGRLQSLTTLRLYSACLSWSNPPNSSEIRVNRVQFTIFGADQSPISSVTSVGSFSFSAGSGRSDCNFASLSTPPSAPVATSYRLVVTYRYFDGSGGDLTGSSTFQ